MSVNINTNGALTPIAGTPINLIHDESKTRSVMGAKNFVKFPFAGLSGSGKLQSISYEVKDDGTVVMSCDGSYSSNIFFTFFGTGNRLPIKAGTYILSGCPSSGINSNDGLYIWDPRTSDYYWSTMANPEYTFTIPEDQDLQLSIRIYGGTRFENVVFKPMIRLASDKDDTFQPYARTNKELSDGYEVLGKYYYKTEVFSVPSSTTATDYYFTNWTLPAGNYIAIMTCPFPKNANGFRFSRVGEGTSMGTETTGATNGEFTTHNITDFVHKTTSFTPSVRLMQNSGSTLSVDVRAVYVRIK